MLSTTHDRVAARRSLWRLRSPAEVKCAKGDAEVVAMLFVLDTLMQCARPLSSALLKHLKPWVIERQRRRTHVLRRNRRADRDFLKWKLTVE